MTSPNADTFVIGKLPPNTVLVLKRQPKPILQTDQEQVARLKEQDMEVRAHEQAHVRAAEGNVVAKPQYKHTIGPDGKAYATSGEVQVQIKVDLNDSQKALAEAEKLRRVALAPHNPSAADASAASVAREIEMKVMGQPRQDDDATEVKKTSNDLDVLA